VSSGEPDQTLLRAPAAVRLVDLDLGEDLPLAREGEPYRSAYVVGTRRGRPVAVRTVALEGARNLSAATLAELFGDAPLGPAEESLSAPLPSVSVVITTCAEDASVSRTVTSVLECDPPPLEVIVVENRPARSTVGETLARLFGSDPRVRFIEECAVGVSHARNAGLLAANGGVVAFTDDDVIVDRAWIGAIAQSFARQPDAGCVTGLILPLDLETDAQVYVEQFAGFGKGWDRRVYSIDDPTSELFPFAAGEFGSGACTAVRRDIAVELGGFAAELGAGTLARGGEDLDLYVRVLLGGHTLVYEPAVFLWHRHLRTARELHREIFSYGIGLSAMVTKQMAEGQARLILRRVPAGLRFLRDPASRKNIRKAPGYPRKFDWIERAGFAAGPLAYMASARRETQLDGGGFTDGPASRAWREYEPSWVGEVDVLEAPIALHADAVAPHPAYRRARILVRRGVEPLGLIELALRDGEASPEVLREQVEAKLAMSWDREGVAGRFAGDLPALSVVICTRERPGQLHRALESVLASDVEDFEVVVVDNAPDGPSTRDCVESFGDARLRYVCEPVPGLSRARNRGVASATGEILAFTDDDVIVDAAWLRQLAGAFGASPRIACATGLVLAAELETAAQAYFDTKVGWVSGLEPRLFDLRENRGKRLFFPYAAGEFGTGANFAVRRDAFKDVGLFDEALGTGTPARGGEDLDFFARVIVSGAVLAYEPSALAWHFHRRDLESLRSQLYGYGSGLGAYAFKQVLRGNALGQLVASAMTGTPNGGRVRDSDRPGHYSALGLAALELRGLASGPVLYLRGEQLARRHPPIEGAPTMAAA
jgi:GT2 family glycosyltransferase